MRDTLPDLERDFVSLELEFLSGPHENVFAKRNNVTVDEMLTHKKYKKLIDEMESEYRDILDKPLGEALLDLKQKGDKIYEKFLHEHGDMPYYALGVKREDLDKLPSPMGIYVFFEGDTPRYIGKCTSVLHQISYDIGKISPLKCYLDGQPTNCRLNAMITKSSHARILRFYAMHERTNIKQIRNDLIQIHKPSWNLGGNGGHP